MSFTISQTQEQDCEHIGPLMRSVWMATYLGILTEEELLEQSFKVHKPELILAEISNKLIASYVAQADGLVVGHVRADLKDGGTVYIARLYLLPEFHGKGIGAQLLGVAESHFPNVSTVKLDVYEDNEAAKGFYQAQGYEVYDRATETKSRGKDVFVFKMQKNIVQEV